MLAVMPLCAPAHGWAGTVVLKDGRILEGRMLKLTSMAEKASTAPSEGAPTPKLIYMIDDNLRRTYVPKTRVLEANEGDAGTVVERFTVRQRITRHGARVAQVGPFIGVEPWDEWGRRTVQMSTNQGVIDVIQGITQITPQWTKVEAVEFTEGKNFIWDMRLATSSVPPDTLRRVLGQQINPTKIEERLQLARLFLQSERYKDAEKELEQIIRDFPENKKQFSAALRDLKQQYARRALAEIDVRRAAGQHQLAIAMLDSFPAEGVAGETLQAVKQKGDEYRGEWDRYIEIVKRLDADVAVLAAKDSLLDDRLKPIQAEIKNELTIHSVGRMAAYRQFWDDNELDTEAKVALAVSGWLVGANDAVRKLPVALSLFETRNLARKYLTEPIKLNRDRILGELEAQEGATPEMVARLLEHMLPPLPAPEADKKQPGFFELEVDTLSGEPPVTYDVQLPPEYDPHRLYPTVVTLRGAGTTPRLQIDWWAGPRAANGQRLGQATRYGYIVVAPDWAKEEQTGYKFSAAEHAAVLNTLRDACRRFSIDTDRVFLSGHSMGGDAAWDIGLAHPDLWAGVIPIVARIDKFVTRMWENARYVNLYLVGGELDGDKSAHNAKDIDRYMQRGYNVTVTEFQGRGHEDFSDEILRLFDWMNLYERDFYPKEFKCCSMRPWDNYFWWVELDGFAPKTLVDPEDWPPPRGTRPATTTATANANNGFNVVTGAGKVTCWLSPGIIDFKQRTTITVNGARARLRGPFVEPDLEVMLDDARTRGDRRHPFWAKVEMP
ncbi:MAG TPA: peptidase [Pirellulales bacterium]|nr:peptidase [Pirellulales bacterium]